MSPVNIIRIFKALRILHTKMHLRTHVRNHARPRAHTSGKRSVMNSGNIVLMLLPVRPCGREAPLPSALSYSAPTSKHSGMMMLWKLVSRATGAMVCIALDEAHRIFNSHKTRIVHYGSHGLHSPGRSTQDVQCVQKSCFALLKFRYLQRLG